ncbi:MAG: DUF4258 domain-containing protein [Desulfococcaceae bacterium]|jgi:hypothetical protein|nr:DUF4258 domain-containing protein [Desulfococcaceae bacterium]
MTSVYFLIQKKIRKLAAENVYQLSGHAEKERESDMISVEELETALKHSEIIENYPDDPRGASCLVLGFCESRPIHAVCTIMQSPEELLIITVYDPSMRPDKWTDNYRKRR